MKYIKFSVTMLTLVTTITACSFVSLNPQAQNVMVSQNKNTLDNCKFLGNTNVSLWSSADTFQSQQKIESQLDTLARNQAATMGGNTVAADTAINNNQRGYSVYNCPNK